MKQRHLLSLLRGHRMKRLLRRMLDETEFLSDFGVRAISRHHLDHPYDFRANGHTMSVKRPSRSAGSNPAAWILRRPEITSVLIGASDVQQIEENVKGLENLQFSEEELNAIDKLCPG